MWRCSRWVLGGEARAPADCSWGQAAAATEHICSIEWQLPWTCWSSPLLHARGCQQSLQLFGSARRFSLLTCRRTPARHPIRREQSGASVELLAAVKQLLRKNSPALLLERDPTATYFCAEVALRVLEGSNLGVDLEMLYGLRLGQGRCACWAC